MPGLRGLELANVIFGKPLKYWPDSLLFQPSPQVSIADGPPQLPCASSISMRYPHRSAFKIDFDMALLVQTPPEDRVHIESLSGSS
jgi:hypothetical protein